MKLDLPVRWKDKQAFTEEESLSRRALDMEEEVVVYTTGFMVLDTDDVRNWNPTDDGCVTVRTYSDDAYAIALSYDEFNNLWTQVTSENIMQIRVKEKEKKIPKKTLR